jgi:hypothetical protein
MSATYPDSQAEFLGQAVPSNAVGYWAYNQSAAGSRSVSCDSIARPRRAHHGLDRTQTNGLADYANVRKIQDGYKLTLLSGWGNGDYVPPKGTVAPAVDMRTPPPVQADRRDAAAAVARFAEVLKDDPPNQVDYPTLYRLQWAGIEAGKRSPSAPHHESRSGALSQGHCPVPRGPRRGCRVDVYLVVAG